MTTPPARTTIFPVGAITGAAAKGAMGTWFDFVMQRLAAGLAGIGTATGAEMQATRVSLGVAEAARVGGLVGGRNATVPTTQYDFSALSVSLADANGGAVLRANTGTLTCNLATAGPVANGRDRAAVFAANTFIYLYFIWNPSTSTLATLASVNPPATGPAALPAGFTHWAFATTLRWGPASQIVPQFSRGSWVFYDWEDGAAGRILTAGTSTAFVPIGDGSYIPMTALVAKYVATMAASLAAGAGSALNIRNIGSTHNGQAKASAVNPTATTASMNSNAEFTMPVVGNTQLEYKLTGSVLSGGGYVDILGYTIANGDV